jgi:hypothetical protein
MALFQKAIPADLIAADLKTSIAKRRDIEQRLSRAEAQAVECRASVDELTRDAADDSAVAAALASKRAAEDLVVAWQKSLADVNEKILDLEDAVTELADQKTRKETAAAIGEISKAFVEAGAAFDIATGKYIDATRRAADFVPDAAGLLAYLSNAKAEVPVATAFIAQILKDRAAATIAGSAKAELVTPAGMAPATPKPTPSPATATIFFLRASKWTDANGLQLIQKCTDATLPTALARHAIQLGVAVERSDKRRKELHGSWTGKSLHAQFCVALDSASAISAVTALTPQFQQVDRGGPVIGTISPPMFANGTRTEKSRP